MQDIVIFGAGKIAQAVTEFLLREKSYNICAYSSDKDFIKSGEFLEKELIPADLLEKRFPPDKFKWQWR